MSLGHTITQFLLAIFLTLVAVYFLVEVWKIAKVPSSEGFAGPARGAGVPDCLRTSQNASDLYELFASKQNTTEEGPDDLREFTLLLSKISCLKKDLMSPSGIIEATRYQAYSTAHDIEPVAETVARCLAKTIPDRDLSIILEKWNTRGTELLLRLCSSFQLTDSEVTKAKSLFKAAIVDITDISKSMCLKNNVDTKLTSRDVAPYEPSALKELREYKGYY